MRRSRLKVGSQSVGAWAISVPGCSRRRSGCSGSGSYCSGERPRCSGSRSSCSGKQSGRSGRRPRCPGRRSDCSGRESGRSRRRKSRSRASPITLLKSGTLERAAPTSADPKEKLRSASVEGCFGNGSRSLLQGIGSWLPNGSEGGFRIVLGRLEALVEHSGNLRKAPLNPHRCPIPGPEGPSAADINILQWI